MSNRSDVQESGAESADASGLAATAEEISDLADVFSLLGDPGRLRMLLALRDGEVSVGALSTLTGQSESAVSHALQLLRAHRIVRVRREGRRAYYRLDDPHVQQLLDVALTHTEHAAMQHPELAEAPVEPAGAQEAAS